MNNLEQEILKGIEDFLSEFGSFTPNLNSPETKQELSNYIRKRVQSYLSLKNKQN
jgi:hypothetical protein